MVKPADVPLATFVPKVAEMGYSAIELWTRDEYFVEAVALARKHGLAVAETGVKPLNTLRGLGMAPEKKS